MQRATALHLEADHSFTKPTCCTYARTDPYSSLDEKVSGFEQAATASKDRALNSWKSEVASFKRVYETERALYTGARRFAAYLLYKNEWRDATFNTETEYQSADKLFAGQKETESANAKKTRRSCYDTAKAKCSNYVDLEFDKGIEPPW